MASQRTFHVTLPTQSVEDATKSITISDFRITTRKLPISKAGPIEEMTEKLGITPPEMIFGDNFVRLEYVPSVSDTNHASSEQVSSSAPSWAVEFNAFDALDLVDKRGEDMLKVAYSREWQANRKQHYSDIQETPRPFDWSYSTRYLGSSSTTADLPTHLGTIKNTEAADTAGKAEFHSSHEQIPIEKLKQPDPIRFFDDVPLYEDELADNGTSLLSVKIRVMPARLLLLARFFMRLDDVVVRVRDTRIFVEFETGEVIREYLSKEEKFADIKRRLTRSGEDVNSALREPQILAEGMPVVERVLEKIRVK